MSIKSDLWIERQCVMPETYFDQAGYDAKCKQGHSVPLTTWAAERYWADLKASFTKPLTDEMKAAWKPMIAPYELNSVRMVENQYHWMERNALYKEWVKENPDTPPPADMLGKLDIEADKRWKRHRRVLSYGSSSYGYDIRLTEEFKIFTNINSVTLDPKDLSSACFVTAYVHTDPQDGSRYVLLPPNSYLLGSTVEYFNIPRNVTGVCLGKSTYARIGAIVNVTPLEAGWSGNLVVEISNATNLPMKIYAGEGIAQLLFFESDEECRTSYAERGGKYQRQLGLQLPIV